MVDCLVSYTKPESHIEDPSEAPGEYSCLLTEIHMMCLTLSGPSNSCWCLLVDQLLTYTLSTPRVRAESVSEYVTYLLPSQAFLSGLMLLSELLPLPLPLHSPKVCHHLLLSSSLSCYRITRQKMNHGL